jgi:hypothetical protein
VLRALALAILLVPSAGLAQDDAPALEDPLDDPLEDAREALRDGDPERAIAILERAREAADVDPEVHRDLSLAYEQAHRWQDAAAGLEAYLASPVQLDDEERRELRGEIADLRARAGPAPPGRSNLVEVAGWAQLLSGVAALVVFALGLGLSFALENNLTSECRTDPRLCPPGQREPIPILRNVGYVGLGAGLVLAALGTAYLVLAGAQQEGASRSLPPDLDPSMQRPFSLSIDESGGRAALTLSF